MRDMDLSKGSGNLYGDFDLLGKIKSYNSGHTIKKSEEEEDELEKRSDAV